MSQLSLNIIPRIAYSPESFLLHQGVRDLVASYQELFVKESFVLSFIVGDKRCGKTHLSIKLTDLAASEQDRYAHIVEGKQFASWIAERMKNHVPASDEVIIVDDADEYFMSVQEGASGPFVNLIEYLRAERATIVFLSSYTIEDLPCDDHVKSRLFAGVNFTLNQAPAEEDLQELILVMARQRGIHLSARKLAYVYKRIGRDIPSIESYLDNLNHLSHVLGEKVKFPLLADAM